MGEILLRIGKQPVCPLGPAVTKFSFWSVFVRRGRFSVAGLCISLLCLLQAGVWAQGASDSIALPDQREDFHLFVLAGQSNMAGRGQVAPMDEKVHPRVLMLNQDASWGPAVDPLHFDKPRVVGVGPGKAFAVRYAEDHPGVTVGLVPCAAGGSPLDAWTPGGYHSQTDSHPYDDAVARCQLASRDGVIKGILWHQGESDSKPAMSETYAQKLEELIARLRSDLDAQQVPFLIGQLAQFEEKPWSPSRETVNAAHQQVAKQTELAAFVPSDGLTPKSDRVHFDAASARELGQRYYAAYQFLDANTARLVLPPSANNPRNSEGDFLVLDSGRILFIYTRFTGGAGDADSADLMLRMSDDGGRSWSQRDEVVLRNEAAMNIMSVSLLRLHDGRIGLFYMRKNSLADCRPVVRFSSDQAKSWSEPVEIVSDEHVGYYVLNNDRVVQLDDGRLVVPLALHNTPESTQPDWAGQITSYQSNDAGKTWSPSQTLQMVYAADGSRITAQEPGVVSLRDGRLMKWVRTDAGQQYKCFSTDRGDSWSKLQPMDLPSPRSPASIERIPATGDLLAVWNDHTQLPLDERKNRTPLSVALSADDGETWSESLAIETSPQGWFCYTAIEFLEDAVLLGYCAGEQAADKHLATTVVKRLPHQQLYTQLRTATIVRQARIWDSAKHSAFTDLLHYNDTWFCVFREGTKHVSPDGALRVLSSPDAVNWESAALVTHPHADLRDAKLTVTPSGQLMLSGAGAMHPEQGYKHQSMSWFSDDGRTWSPASLIGERDYWLWRTTWQAGQALAVGYHTGDGQDKHVRLYSSTDGKEFRSLVANLFSEGYPNETAMLYNDAGQATCLLRRDGASQTGMLGTAQPPYTQWHWRDLGVRIGGPQMLELPDGRIVAAVRLYDSRVRTALCWLNVESGTLTEFLSLPSGGDTSYPGMVWHDNHLWVSYYSSHESSGSSFTSAIYLSKVDLGLH